MQVVIATDEQAADLRAAGYRTLPVGEDFEHVVEAMVRLSPRPVVESSTATEQARRNAGARTAFLAENPVLTAAEVAGIARSTARNRSALASRWAAEGACFSVPTDDGARFPSFQFDDDGRPRPIVATVIAGLRHAGVTGWALAIWWVTPSDVLDGAAPLDVIGRPDLVGAALDADLRLFEIPRGLAAE